MVDVVEDLKLHDLTEGERMVGAYFIPTTQGNSRFLTTVPVVVVPALVAWNLR